MTPYADTSFYGSLLEFSSNPRTAEAKAWMSANTEPIILSRLNEMEIRTVLHRCETYKTLPRAKILKAWAAFENLVARKVLVLHNEATADEIYDEAKQVLKDASKESGKSLDVMHLAYARRYQADTILTFDKQQNKLAGHIGLTVPMPV